MIDEPGATFRIYDEQEFRHLLAWEAQRCNRYQDFLCLCLVRFLWPGLAIRDAVARHIAELLRSTDTVGFMGENIGILLLHTPDPEASAIMQRVRNRIEDASFPADPGGAPVQVKLHLALVTLPEDGTNDVDLLTRAQTRLAEDPDAAPPHAP